MIYDRLNDFINRMTSINFSRHLDDVIYWVTSQHWLRH